VSPLWRDEVGIYFAPHRICLVRVGRGLRPAMVREEDHPRAPSGALAQSGAGWEAMLPALESHLSQSEWTNARARFVIGDTWVRYTVVPWSDALSSNEEHVAHARELMSSIFGDDLSEWSVSLSEAPPGVSRLACAMPAGLLRGLSDITTGHGLTLTSVQPQLIASFNSWRHRLPAADAAWFVTVEEGSLAALRMCADGIDRVHAVRIGLDWARELKRLQTFGRLASGSPTDGRVYVDVPPALRALRPGAATDLEWLEEPEAPLTTLHRLEQLRRRAA